MGRPMNSVSRMVIHDVELDNECWVWRGGVGAGGYGKTAIMGRTLLPHRVFYEHFVGAIPHGFQVDHLCKNRLCVNPAHLEAVTPAENNARSSSPSALNADKVFCLRGHALAGDNVYLTKTGKRHCKKCNVIRMAKFRERSRG